MTRDERIRIVYARRRRFTRRHAADVLGRSPAWVERNRFEPERGGFLAWEEVVLLGNTLWTQRQIQSALGARAAAVLPPLRLLVPLTIELPKFKVLHLRYLARRSHIDVSEIISLAVDVPRNDVEDIEAVVPGALAAWRFPYLESARGEGAAPAAVRRALVPAPNGVRVDTESCAASA